jgi:hypothetical protein
MGSTERKFCRMSVGNPSRCRSFRCRFRFDILYHVYVVTTNSIQASTLTMAYRRGRVLAIWSETIPSVLTPWYASRLHSKRRSLGTEQLSRARTVASEVVHRTKMSKLSTGPTLRRARYHQSTCYLILLVVTT